jgi:hypothetical protein
VAIFRKELAPDLDAHAVRLFSDRDIGGGDGWEQDERGEEKEVRLHGEISRQPAMSWSTVSRIFRKSHRPRRPIALSFQSFWSF